MLGIDLVKMERIQDWPENSLLLETVFTSRELSRGKGIPYLAKLFSVKEACMKALGTGWGQGVSWKDMEILPDSRGNLQLNLFGKAQEISNHKNIYFNTIQQDQNILAIVYLAEK